MLPTLALPTHSISCGNSCSSTGEASAEVKDPVTADRDHHANKGKPREGISPLDYVKNRIVEVMRTENKEDKGEDESSEPSGVGIGARPTTNPNSVVGTGNMSSSPGLTSDSHVENHRETSRVRFLVFAKA